MRYFCTLSDKKYIYHGLSLLKSLRRWAGDFVLYYLCLDEETKQAIFKIGGNDVVAVSLSAFENVEPQVNGCRNRPEMHQPGMTFDSYSQFCWALAPLWTCYLLDKVADQNGVSYLDSDLFFRQPVEPIFQALGDKSIGIFRHRHNGNPLSGEYNVNMVCFRGDAVGKSCARWWRSVMLDPKNQWAEKYGTCGDQKYLELFAPLLGQDHVAVLDDQIGHGAPWNYPLYQYDGDHIVWEGKRQLLVFNHFSHFIPDFANDTYKFAYEHEWGDCIVHEQVRKWYDEYFATMKSIRDKIEGKQSKLSVLVFSKDRPLFLKTCLESLDSSLDITVLYLATNDDYTQAYIELTTKFPAVKFVNQEAKGDIRQHLRRWLKTATEFVMVTVDDNIFSGRIDSEAIRKTMADQEMFGFTLRLAPGIYRTQDNNVASSWPDSTESVVVYEPAKYQCPWNYVWEMSSTFYRKSDMERVVESMVIANPNDLEIAGLRLFNAQSAKKMACFSRAPATNIFVDSWASPQCVTSQVSNDLAFRLYREGREIDLTRTFRERDAKGVTHVKRLFLKPKKLHNRAIVVVIARNAESWIAKSLESVLGQTYQDLGLVFLDDGSDDQAYEVAFELLKNRADTAIISQAERCYLVADIDFAVRECCANSESAIFIVDGHDWQICPTAIAEMMVQHQTADVVWSKCLDGETCSGESLSGRKIRNQPMVASRFRSFKKFLYDAIKQEDLLDVDGKVYRMIRDQAILFPLLEMVSLNRRRYYAQALYRDNPVSEEVDHEEQQRMEMRIRSRQSYAVQDRCRVDSSCRVFPEGAKALTNSAIVAILSWNAEKWTQQCLRSVLAQTHSDLGIIFVDDHSDDGSFKVAQLLLTGRKDAILVSRAERWLATKNWNSAIREYCSNPESVIFQLDGDDWLASNTAVEEMMKEHETADVVWSRHRCTDGSACCCGPVTGEDMRNHFWVTSHLRSFKKFLFDAIRPEDFFDEDGEMYQLSCDQAIMVPILEMVPGERRRFYDQELYIYNRDNPVSDSRTHTGEEGWRITCHIRSRRPYGKHPRYG